MNLPLPLMVSEPGSFAEHTIMVRIPRIIDDVVARNAYPRDIVAALTSLKSEMATGPLTLLQEEAPDVAFWRQACGPWRGKKWRQLAWFFAETFFYRRLLEAVRYFQEGPWHHVDPFEPQKRQELARSLDTMADLGRSFPRGAPIDEQFALWLQRSLWGNRADLSNLVTMAHAHRQRPSQETDKLLIDHTAQAWTLFASAKVGALGLVTDNCGLELLCDLGLIDWLLQHNLAGEVHLHMKPQPYFVSDAMVKDLEMTVDALGNAPYDMLRALGERTEGAITSGKLSCHAHPFWSTCLGLSSMPDDLRGDLAGVDLLILKGDVNYRRLLDDRHWDPTTDLAAVTRFMPGAFLTLRTLKGELIAGLKAGQAESLARLDPQWLLNGERGLIHLVDRNSI